MNHNLKRAASFAVGAAILTVAIMPVLMPERVTAAAKWVNLKPSVSADAEVHEKNNSSNVELTTPAAEEAVGGVVVLNKDGEFQKVIIEEMENENVITVAIDKELVEKRQQAVDAGEQNWLLDPVEVVRNDADKYGFDAKKDSITLVSPLEDTISADKRKVLVRQGTQYYVVELIQPERLVGNKIWQVVSIKKVKTTAAYTHKKPDIGPGVEGLDYDKVIKWQQNVDEGRELWRLDPMQVAKKEGKNYGFTEQDTFTIVKKLNSSAISRHGQINIEVTHQGEKYTMILVKPFGGPDAIWTIYKAHVIDNLPENPASTRVLFETSKYKDWKFHSSQYPQDMFFATIVNFNGKLTYDDRVPDNTVSKFKRSKFNNKLILFANMGTSPAQSAIGIEKVTLSGNDMIVYVHTKSPRPDEFITMNVIYPEDYVTIDVSILQEQGRVNITFVDQNGKVLSKNKLTVKG
ncbi:MAG: protease complex subunit PrcB family protein [Sporomusaceae bacterium]|nr:protease complex subunit PrcB family protein [Sporomusaceae bacterium]